MIEYVPSYPQICNKIGGNMNDDVCEANPFGNPNFDFMIGKMVSDCRSAGGGQTLYGIVLVGQQEMIVPIS